MADLQSIDTAKTGGPAHHRRRPTIGTSFDIRRNSMNFWRVAFALIVIYVHSGMLTGHGHAAGLRIGATDIGSFALGGFFVISGFLLARSRMTSRTLGGYLWRRVLRVFPAYWTVLVMTAVVFAPLSTLFTGAAIPVKESATYLLNNFTLYITQWGIGDTLAATPYPNVWNGSIWTLFFEFLCYIILGVGFTVLPRRWWTTYIGAVFVLFVVVNAVYYYTGYAPHDMLRFLAQIGVYFMGGTLLYLWRDRVPYSLSLLGVSVALCAVVFLSGSFFYLGAVPYTYTVVAASIALPRMFQKVNAKNDFTYGLYVYTMPLQQLLVLAFPERDVPQFVAFLVAVAVSAPFAVASWFWIERPAMRLKSRWPLVRWDPARNRPVVGTGVG